jgi:hypothetical protein
MNLLATITIAPAPHAPRGWVSESVYFLDGIEISAAEYGEVQSAAWDRANADDGEGGE